MGSPPTAPLAGPGYSALPPPGPAPRPTPPLAVPGLWETEKGLREGRRHRRGGEGTEQAWDRAVPGHPGLSPAVSSALFPMLKRTESNQPRGQVFSGC